MLEGESASLNSTMKPLTSKQLQRIENKKKKIAAFLEIAKLNDKDREVKAVINETREDECTDSVNDSGNPVPLEEPSRKRQKKDNKVPEVNIVIENSECVPSNNIENRESHSGVEPGSSSPDNYPPGFSDKGNMILEGEEFAQLKRELRERKNRLRYIPRFRLRDMGACAALAVKNEDRTPLFLSDIQHLLMYSMLGHHSPYHPYRWCCLEKFNRISHTVVLLIEGLSLYDFIANESMFPLIAKVFTSKVEVITPVAYNGSLVEELAAVPLTNSQKDKLVKEFGSLEVAMMHKEDLFKVLRAIFPVVESSYTSNQIPRPTSDRFPRTHLLLSASQLVEENYPVPLKGKFCEKYTDFVLTKDLYHEVTPSSPMFGLDCEMCRTTSGELELTRVSIVNEQLKVIYETLVKPHNRITNYLTHFSGITKQILADVTVRLEDVQKDIRELLPPDAILVGQSLHFDLRALKMMHPYVIDTSVIYNVTGERYRKTKLSLLAEKFLGESIQQGDKGHCSVEDSSTSMKLAQLKLANDVEFGDAVLAERRATMARLKQVQPASTRQEVATSLFSHVTRLEKTAAIVGSQEVIDEYLNYMSETMFSIEDSKGSTNKRVKCIVTSNESVVAQTCNIAREHTFTLAHVRLNRTDSDISDDIIKRVNKWCKAVWEHMAYNGMCVVLLSGQKGGANGACFIEVKRPPTDNLECNRLF